MPLVAGVTAGLVAGDPVPPLISRLKGLVDLVVSTEGVTTAGAGGAGGAAGGGVGALYGAGVKAGAWTAGEGVDLAFKACNLA